MTSEQGPPVLCKWHLGTARVGHLRRVRRSIRPCMDRPVEREVIGRLIHIAGHAPSGHNSQPVHWLVIYDSNEVQRLAGLVVDWMRYLLKEQSPLAKVLHMDRIVAIWDKGIDRICRGAPHIIVTHAPKEDRAAQSACTIALAYLELAAPSFKLGACWAGYFNAASTLWPAMQDALGLPEGHAAFGALMVGYPKYRYHRLPLRNEARIEWR